MTLTEWEDSLESHGKGFGFCQGSDVLGYEEAARLLSAGSNLIRKPKQLSHRFSFFTLTYASGVLAGTTGSLRGGQGKYEWNQRSLDEQRSTI